MVVAGAAVYFVSTERPWHTDPAAVPSSTAGVERPASGNDAIEEASRRPRALLVGGGLPGLSVAVAVNGDIAWAEGFGYADVDHAPVTPRTRFRLGALSKPITAVAVGLLHDRGRIDL